MHIGCKEGLYRRPRFGRPSVPVPLERRLDCAAEGLGTPLVPPLACLNPCVDQTLGLRGYPDLKVSFPLGWTGGGSLDLGKHMVCLVRGRRGPDKEACTLT